MTQPARACPGAIAASHADAAEAILAKRRLPCICPRQDEGATGVTVGYSTCRGMVTERVRCEFCPRTWARTNAR